MKLFLSNTKQLIDRKDSVYNTMVTLHKSCPIQLRLGDQLDQLNSPPERKVKRRNIKLVTSAHTPLPIKKIVKEMAELNSLIVDPPKKTIPLKQTFRLLNLFIRYVLEKRNGDLTSLRLLDHFYTYFKNLNGSSQMVDKKIREFLGSFYSYRTNKRVEVFLRMFGMFNDIKYSLFEEKLYLETYEKLVKKETQGFDIKIDYEKCTQRIPMIRINYHLDKFLKYRVSESTKKFINDEIAKFTQVDETGANTEGVVDFDEYMLLIFSALNIEKNSKIGS